MTDQARTLRGLAERLAPGGRLGPAARPALHYSLGDDTDPTACTTSMST